MTFEEIQEMWEQDSKIDPVELDTASLAIPTLHSKYYKIFSDYKFKRKLAALDLKQLYRRKFEYYSGRGEPADSSYVRACLTKETVHNTHGHVQRKKLTCTFILLDTSSSRNYFHLYSFSSKVADSFELQALAIFSVLTLP